MKKRLFFIFLLLLCSACFCSCEKNTAAEKNTSLTAGTEINSSKLFDYSAMLNHSDEDVVAMLGEGEPSYQDEGNTVISTRLYQSNLLGFDGEAVLIYEEEEEPTVNEVLISFNGAKYNDVIDALSQQLGDAALKKEDGNTVADAQWQQENVVYSLTSYEGNIMLGIWNDYGVSAE